MLSGNEAHFFVRIKQREHRLRDGGVGQVLVGAFDRVLDRVGQEFELVHQVRKFRRVDLGELEFPLRQLAQDFFGDGGRDAGGAAVDELCNFRHDGGNL